MSGGSPPQGGEPFLAVRYGSGSALPNRECVLDGLTRVPGGVTIHIGAYERAARVSSGLHRTLDVDVELAKLPWPDSAGKHRQIVPNAATRRVGDDGYDHRLSGLVHNAEGRFNASIGSLGWPIDGHRHVGVVDGDLERDRGR